MSKTVTLYLRALLAVLATLLVLALPIRAQAEDLTGHLLIATPELGDSNFEQTVIYLVAHDESGAFGLVVNEPMGELPLARLLGGSASEKLAGGESESAAPIKVHYGGPVEPKRAFLLYSSEVKLAGSVDLGNGVAFSNRRETIESLTGAERPRHLVLTLGYAGWAPGQLEAEIERGSWYVAEWDEFLVFGANNAAKWAIAIARFGPEL